MEASQAEKNVFGEDCTLHPITKRPLERGRGALPDDVQAAMHIMDIEREGGKELADAMRAKLFGTPVHAAAPMSDPQSAAAAAAPDPQPAPTAAPAAAANANANAKVAP